MKESFFNQTYILNSEFNNLDLEGSELLNMKIDELDLSNSNIAKIKINAYSLKGMSVNPTQAINLITILGVKVK